MMLSVAVRRWRSRFVHHAVVAAYFQQHSSCPHLHRQGLGFISGGAVRLPSATGEDGEAIGCCGFFTLGYRTLTTDIRIPRLAVSEIGDAKVAEVANKLKLQKINGVIRRRKWDAEMGKQLERLRFKLSPALVCDVVMKQKDLKLARYFFAWGRATGGIPSFHWNVHSNDQTACWSSRERASESITGHHVEGWTCDLDASHNVSATYLRQRE